MEEEIVNNNEENTNEEEVTTYLPSEVAAAILAIPGGGTDTSNDTVTAPDMKAGITAHNAAGTQITGTMPNFNSVAFGELENPPTEGYISGATMEALARAIEALGGNSESGG